MDLNYLEGKNMKKIQMLISDTALFLRDLIPNKYVTLSNTVFESNEGMIGAFQSSKNYQHAYYTLDRVINNPEARYGDNDVLTKTKFYLSPKQTKIKRTLYDVLKLMSEIGGFLKLVNIMLYTAVHPIIQFLYFMIMIKRLYYAKTSESDIFQPQNNQQSSYVKNRLSKYTDDQQIPKELRNTGFRKDIRDHKEIRLSCRDKFFLFFHVYLGCL